MSHSERRTRSAALLLIAAGLVLLLNLTACLVRGQIMTGLALWGVGLLAGAVLLLEAPAVPVLIDPSLTDSEEH